MSAAKKAVAAAKKRNVHDAVTPATEADHAAAARGDRAAANRVATARAMNEVHPALREVPAAPGSNYKVLVAKDRDAELPLDARLAMARRSNEIAAARGRYVPGAQAPSEPKAPTDRAEAGASRGRRAVDPTTSGRTQGDVAMSTKNKGFVSTKDAQEIQRAHAQDAKETAARDAAKAKEAAAKKAKADTAAAKKVAKTRAEKKAADEASAKAKSQLAAGARAAQAATKKAAAADTAKKDFAGFPLDAKIKVLNHESDFHEGSIRDKAFKGIIRCATVADAKKVSTDPWHLRTAVKSKKVKVS